MFTTDPNLLSVSLMPCGQPHVITLHQPSLVFFPHSANPPLFPLTASGLSLATKYTPIPANELGYPNLLKLHGHTGICKSSGGAMSEPGGEKFLGKTDGVPFFINHQPGWQLDEIGKAETLIWSPSSAPFLPIFFFCTPYSVFISPASLTPTFPRPVFTFNSNTLPPPRAL